MTKTDDQDVKVGDICVATFDVEILKAEESEDGKTGHVVALVSAYNVAYRMGFFTWHKITDGAFAKSIKAQDAVPIFWQHNWDWAEQPPIGTGIPTEEGKGLQVAADFMLDIEAGRAVFNAIKAKALRQWSIGYQIVKFEVDRSADEDRHVVNIIEADLLEASSVLRGANPDTETLKVAGRMPEEIKQAFEAITEFMQAQKDINSSVRQFMDAQNSTNDALAERLEGIEVVHDVMVDSFDLADEVDKRLAARSGEEVEPASVGVGEGPEDAAPQDQAPDGQAKETDTPPPVPSPVDLDDLYEQAHQSVIQRREAEVEAELEAAKQKLIDRAGIGLPGGDDSDVRSIEAWARVLAAENRAGYMWDDVERRTEIEDLARNKM